MARAERKGHLDGSAYDQAVLTSPSAKQALAEYIPMRRGQPHFANARSIRNALDRARLRQANRCFAAKEEIDLEALVTIEAEDIRRSRVFGLGQSS